VARERLRFGLISALCLLSGASALVYETAWLRQILLIVGSTTGAVSAVLAVFMLGLGLGARWVGGLADRSPSPLRLYALLELGVGLYGLALPFVLIVFGSYAAPTRPLGPFWSEAFAALPWVLVSTWVGILLPRLLVRTLRFSADSVAA